LLLHHLSCDLRVADDSAGLKAESWIIQESDGVGVIGEAFRRWCVSCSKMLPCYTPKWFYEDT